MDDETAAELADQLDDDDARKRGIFIGMSKGAGSAGGALSSGLGAVDAFFNPGAARTRDELQRQHEAVIPTPSPGDRLLSEGRVVIEVAAPDSADHADHEGDRD